MATNAQAATAIAASLRTGTRVCLTQAGPLPLIQYCFRTYGVRRGASWMADLATRGTIVASTLALGTDAMRLYKLLDMRPRFRTYGSSQPSGLTPSHPIPKREGWLETGA